MSDLQWHRRHCVCTACVHMHVKENSCTLKCLTQMWVNLWDPAEGGVSWAKTRRKIDLNSSYRDQVLLKLECSFLLLQRETAAMLAHVLCTPYNHAPIYGVTSGKATYIAVTCHLHFWQNVQDHLHATAITLGWNGYRNKNQQRKLEQKNLPPLQQGTQTRDLSVVSLTL